MASKPATFIPASAQVVLHVDPKFIKRVPDPHDARRWNYVGTIPAMEVLKLRRGTANPRNANLGSKVAGEILDTIRNAPMEFHLRNRGLIVSTPDANLDTDSKTLVLDNPKVEKETILWGILDGGHTFDVLSQEAEAAAGDNGLPALAGLKDTWVDIKIRVGLTKDEVVSAAAANNTSTQLRPWTLANFKGQLQPIRQMVEKQLPDLAGDIAFNENQTNDITGQERYWDVLDVLQRMTLLNAVVYPGFDPSRHPVIAYSSKSKVLEEFLKAPDKYRGVANILGDAFRMPAVIEAKLSQLNKVHGNLAFVTKAKPGEVDPALRGKHAIVRKYRTSDAVLFPMVAALRPLIDENGGKLDWTTDPIEFLDNNIDALFQTLLSFYKDEVEDKTNKRSLSGMGKDARLWQTLHAKVLAILAKPKKR
jgi:hypothetical protein